MKSVTKKICILISLLVLTIININLLLAESSKTITNDSDYFSEGIESFLPQFAANQLLGIEYWKYAAIVVILILSYLFYKLFTVIYGFVLMRLFAQFRRKELALNYVKPLAKPISLLFTVIIVHFIYPFLFLPKPVTIVLDYIFLFFIPLMAIVISYRLTDLLGEILQKLAGKTKSTIDDNLVPFFRKGLKVIIVVFGIIYILQNFNINITPLLAGASIGGLAIALAAQETVRNLFGSFTIFSDQPFEVGDWIIFEGKEGVVEEIGVRSTRVRSFNSSLISIPNGKLADLTIDNMGKRIFRRYLTKIGITYGTPVAKIEEFVGELNKLVAEHPKTRKDFYQISFTEFAESSLNILFNIYFDVPDWSEELLAKNEINLEIIKIAERLGIEFAFPTRTIHIDK